MKIEVNVEKRYAIGLVLSIMVLAGVIFAVAYTPGTPSVPNPGHNLTAIQGYFDIDGNLNDTLGRLCQDDGTNCPPGVSGACELLGSRNSGQSQALSIDVPAKCKGRTCNLLLTSTTGGPVSRYVSFRYLQDAPGIPSPKDWVSEGVNRNDVSSAAFTNQGHQGDTSSEIIAERQLGGVLYDDLSGTEVNGDKWSLIGGGGNQVSLYVC